MTPDQRFGVLMAAVTVVAAVTGWLVRALWTSQTQATDANTAALKELTGVVGKLAERLAEVEGRLRRR